MTVKPKITRISEGFIHSICNRLQQNKRVRRTLPVWGRVHIDRQLPFLCVYRRPAEGDDTGTERFLFGEASYLMASGKKSLHKGLSSLVRNIAGTQAERFGGFLILEIWSAPVMHAEAGDNINTQKPAFRLIAPRNSKLSPTLDVLEKALRQVTVMKQRAEIETVLGEQVVPPGLRPLSLTRELRNLGVRRIGLEIKPIYRDGKTGQDFPLVLRRLHHGVARAVKQAFFEFAHTQTAHAPLNYFSLGRRAVVKAVWVVDEKLAEVGNAFDLLLYVSPINAESAFEKFRRSKYEKPPEFYYRPHPVDPALLKRKLFNIPFERIEDPVLAQVFREKREEVDRKITLLANRGTSRFLPASVLAFGGVKDSLLKSALDLLKVIPPRSRGESTGKPLNASEFAVYAEHEFEYYRERCPEFKATTEIRDDVTGLLVSHGKLLIDKSIKIPRSRVNALIHHEVGTHLVSYFNGRAQPFKQLYMGFAGYDALQEGLAVLAEYLSGGLDEPRMRLLAARVVAVHMLVDGASFVDTFRKLNGRYTFDKKNAFTITMRVFRGGGLTKDAVYLKGLIKLLEYIEKGGDLETLFIGKFNSNHISIIRELLWRKVLRPPVLFPRYLTEPGVEVRLRKVQEGLHPSDLVEIRRRKK